MQTIDCGFIANEDFVKLINNMPDNSIDLFITDPPYKVTSRGSSGGTGGMLKKDINKSGQVFDYNDISINDWIHDIYRVMKDTSHGYVMTNNRNLKEYMIAIENANFSIFKVLIWDKGNSITNMYYMDSHEYIIFFRKGKAKKINNCGTKTILSVPNKKTKINNQNIHDTEKPVELMDILILNSSNVGDVVFDPFAGVGSVGISAKKNNRKYIVSDIDKNYYDIMCKRINETKQGEQQ